VGGGGGGGGGGFCWGGGGGCGGGGGGGGGGVGLWGGGLGGFWFLGHLCTSLSGPTGSSVDLLGERDVGGTGHLSTPQRLTHHRILGSRVMVQSPPAASGKLFRSEKPEGRSEIEL